MPRIDPETRDLVVAGLVRLEDEELDALISLIKGHNRPTILEALSLMKEVNRRRKEMNP